MNNLGYAVPDHDRLIEIEIKLTQQEDLVHELNRQVYAQQRQIAELRALCTSLAKRLGQMAADSDGPEPYAEERPPHY